MRHYFLTCDAAPELPARAFTKALGRNAPATLEGGKGGGAPSAPDPWETAAATTQSNQQTAAYNKSLNLNNFTNPFGQQQSYIVGYENGAPVYNTATTASPQLQSTLNGLFGQVGQGQGQIQNSINGIGGAIGQYNNLNQSIAGVGQQISGLGDQLDQNAVKNAQQYGQDAAYRSQTQYLDPQFSQQEESLKASLANQGLTPGSQAYNNAMLNFNNTKQRAYSDAANQSVLTGSQIGSQNLQNQISGINTKAGLFGQQLGAMQNAGSNIGQEAALYGQAAGLGQMPYSNLQSIASMIPGYSGPASSGAQPADIAGYLNNQYQGNLANYNARQASNNSTMGTVGTLGAAAMIAMGF